jgi:hypothetical protein
MRAPTEATVLQTTRCTVAAKERPGKFSNEVNPNKQEVRVTNWTNEVNICNGVYWGNLKDAIKV